MLEFLKHEDTKRRRVTKLFLREGAHAPASKWLMMALGVVFLLQVTAWGMDQAKPGESGKVGGAGDPHAGLAGMGGAGGAAGVAGGGDSRALVDIYAKQDRSGFERDIQLDGFRLMAVEHLDQVKIIDSWARQNLRKIRHRESIDGKNAVLVALDMAFRPQAWMDKNIIYVESVPIREELGILAGNAAEARRIREEALVSPGFLFAKPVAQRLDEISRDSRQMPAVGKVFAAMEAFATLRQTLALIPPTADQRAAPWVFPMDIVAADAKKLPPGAAATNAAMAAGSAADGEELPPYTREQKLQITMAFQRLEAGWQSNDVALANQGLAELAAIAPAIDPAAYPSATKRTVELWYNRAYSGTLVAFVYFAAMVLFFLVAVGVVTKTSRVHGTALVIYGVALAGHATAMGIRWWLGGRIPIQNQFESVMGSALIGCAIGLALEAWKRNGIFGTAFGFVGFLATTVLLAAPYVFGNDLGSAPGKVAGILSTGWLYIHVNIVIASYALIFASAVVAAVYLFTRLGHWINPIEPGYEAEELIRETPGAGPPAAPPRVKSGGTATAGAAVLEARRAGYLDTLDQANMVILQMAFWMLGVGVMCGAVWADQSWGRPWGWDPKETFALVTWMVYLVIVHVRLVVKFKADATSWLSLAGCGVMLFNWIGVNFFLKGLHSYA